MAKHEKKSHGGARQSRANRATRGGARARVGVGLGGETVQEILARGDTREMRRMKARLRKWLKGTYELVDELEQVIVELEEPRR